MTRPKGMLAGRIVAQSWKAKAQPVKRCPKCRAFKDASGFYRCPRRSDGLSAWCKDCQRDHMRSKMRTLRNTLAENFRPQRSRGHRGEGS